MTVAPSHITPTPAPPRKPLELALNKASLGTSDRIVVTADAGAAEGVTPYVRIVAPGGAQYYVTSHGIVAGRPAPFIAAALDIPSPVRGYPVLDLPFSGVAPGEYLLQGAFLRGGEIVGAIDETPLLVR